MSGLGWGADKSMESQEGSAGGVSRSTALEGHGVSGECSSRGHRATEDLAAKGTGKQGVLHTNLRKFVNEVLLLHNLEL